MIGWGAHLQVSGLSHQEPGSGDQVQEIRPLSSIQPSFHFGCQVAAPGGRWRDLSIQSSTQSSTQPSIQSSHFTPAIRHLSSIQPSTLPLYQCMHPHYSILSAFFPTASREPPTASTYPLIRPNFSPAALKVSSFLAKWKRT